MVRRWLVVLLVAAALVVAPLAVGLRPAAASDVSASDLAARIERSANIGWSGFVHSSGSLDIPDTASFANLAQLLGEDNDLRAWWRGPTDWRIDRMTSTGETDLIRQGSGVVRWVFESQRATVSPVSKVRLPDASDLLPPTLARSLLQGARPAEMSRLPTRRIAGISAAGLRLVPDDHASTVGRVNVWADPASGLPLRVELSGTGASRPVLTTTLVACTLRAPGADTTHFRPPASISVNYEPSVDVAAAANAFEPDRLPGSLGGLGRRAGATPGPVGVYGRGPTTLLALPLRGQVAEPLRERLLGSPTARQTAAGTLGAVGPVGVLVTGYAGDRAFLLTGTVTSDTLERAARQLLAR